MAKTKEKAPALTSFADLVAHFEKGAKPDRSTWRIGTEHEKFAFYKDTLEPVPYEGERGIGALLDGLADSYGWQRVMEGGNIIALKQGMASITLEPGGQFELSGAPLEHLHQTCSETGNAPRAIARCRRQAGHRVSGAWLFPALVAGRNARSCPRAATRSCAIIWPRSAGSGGR